MGLTTAPGAGQQCDGCHKPIEPNQVEYRCEAVEHAASATLRFHQWCYYVRNPAPQRNVSC
jgi:hypothetical protein